MDILNVFNNFSHNVNVLTDENVEKNNIKPLPCDKEFDLYEMKATITDEPINGVRTQCHQSGCQQYVLVFDSLSNHDLFADNTSFNTFRTLI